MGRRPSLERSCGTTSAQPGRPAHSRQTCWLLIWGQQVALRALGRLLAGGCFKGSRGACFKGLYGLQRGPFTLKLGLGSLQEPIGFWSRVPASSRSPSDLREGPRGTT